MVTNSGNLNVDFDQSHWLVTGCPDILQECHWSAHILPFRRQNTFNYIKIHINRETRNSCSSDEWTNCQDSSRSDTRGPEEGKTSQDGLWYILTYQGQGGILVYGVTGTVSKPKIPIFPFTCVPGMTLSRNNNPQRLSHKYKSDNNT